MIGRRVIRSPRDFARYSRTNRAPAALLLFGLAVGLWSFRRGRLPTAREAAGWAIAAVIVVLLASFMPELVVAFLGAALIAIALDDSARIEAVAGRLFSMIEAVPANTRDVGAGAGAGPTLAR